MESTNQEPLRATGALGRLSNWIHPARKISKREKRRVGRPRNVVGRGKPVDELSLAAERIAGALRAALEEGGKVSWRISPPSGDDFETERQKFLVSAEKHGLTVLENGQPSYKRYIRKLYNDDAGMNIHTEEYKTRTDEIKEKLCSSQSESVSNLVVFNTYAERRLAVINYFKRPVQKFPATTRASRSTVDTREEQQCRSQSHTTRLLAVVDSQRRAMSQAAPSLRRQTSAIEPPADVQGSSFGSAEPVVETISGNPLDSGLINWVQCEKPCKRWRILPVPWRHYKSFHGLESSRFECKLREGGYGEYSRMPCNKPCESDLVESLPEIDRPLFYDSLIAALQSASRTI